MSHNEHPAAAGVSGDTAAVRMSCSTETCPVLQTGQRSCHDADGREIPCGGSGQDAEFRRGLAWPNPRFEAQGEVVCDRLTGLVWTRDAAPGELPMTWRESFDFVANTRISLSTGRARGWNASRFWMSSRVRPKTWGWDTEDCAKIKK